MASVKKVAKKAPVKKKLTFLQELKRKWHAPTPENYKTIRRYCLAGAAFCVALVAAPGIPAWIGTTGIVLGAIAAFAAELQEA